MSRLAIFIIRCIRLRGFKAALWLDKRENPRRAK